VKTLDGGQKISILVVCVAILYFMSEEFVRRFSLSTLKSKAKNPFRLANGQRVTSTTVCETTFKQAKHEFKRTYDALRDLRAPNLVLGLPWWDDGQAF
jgi:hypothetical protein